MSLTIVAGVTLTGCGENKQGTAEETATTESAAANELDTAGTTEIIEDTPEVETSSTEATVQEEPERTPFESFTPIDTEECAVTINDACCSPPGMASNCSACVSLK